MGLPTSKKWLVDGFCRYTARMIRRQFTCFAVESQLPINTLVPQDHALVVFANHIGWWDPVVAMHLRRAYFQERIFYAPIDAKALQAYGVLRQMGFYGIAMDQMRGAAAFLKTSREILATPRSSLWITPEGKFTDCRDHSQPLMPGLAHLAADTHNVTFVPLAIEYPFWEEVRPMIATRLGAPISFGQGETKQECEQVLFSALRETQAELAASVIRREFDALAEYLVPPKAQRQTWYDTMRAWKSWAQGNPFDPTHRSVTRKPTQSPSND
jgi:1-acyl-sn-glycerol-3-phosphate acyltransferase